MLIVLFVTHGERIFTISFGSMITKKILAGHLSVYSEFHIQYKDFQLYFKNVLFDFVTFEKQYENLYFLCNLIILLATYFIHKCKVLKHKPLFSHFQRDIGIYI